MKTTQRSFQRVAIATMALLVTVSTAWAQSTTTPSDIGTVYTVTGDNVYVRAGGGDSYYPFGKLQRNDLVLVVQQKYGWARVRTVGPAFRAFFGYVEVDPSRVAIEDEGRRGRILFTADLLAPNLNSKYLPEDSWRRILELSPGRSLVVLDSIETDRKQVHKVQLPADAEGWVSVSFLREANAAERERWQKIAVAAKTTKPGAMQPTQITAPVAIEEPTVPPVEMAPARDVATTPPMEAPDRADVRSMPATPERDELVPLERNEDLSAIVDIVEGRTLPALDSTDVPVETPRGGDDVLAGDRNDQPIAGERTAEGGEVVEAGGEPMTDEPTSGQPAPEGTTEDVQAGPPAPPKTPEEQLQDLEEAYQRLREEPIGTAEVVPLRALYMQLAESASTENEPISKYAKTRAEQLTIWADLQTRRRTIAQLQQRLVMTTEETRAMTMALQSTALYAVAGRVATSQIFTGDRLRRLYRIQDPQTGRTLAYVRADGNTGFDFAAMVGQLVGVVGERSPDETTGVNVIAPKRVDLLTGGRSVSG